MEEGQAQRSWFGRPSGTGDGSGAPSLHGLPLFTVNPWGPVKPDVFGNVLYYSIYTYYT